MPALRKFEPSSCFDAMVAFWALTLQLFLLNKLAVAIVSDLVGTTLYYVLSFARDPLVMVGSVTIVPSIFEHVFL